LDSRDGLQAPPGQEARVRGEAERVQVVTSAGRSHTDDLRLRQRRYLLTQAVRLSCVLLAITLPVAVHWKLVFIVASVVLPWFGVVAANAGPAVQRRGPTALVDRPVEQPQRLALDPTRIVDGER